MKVQVTQSLKTTHKILDLCILIFMFTDRRRDDKKVLNCKESIQVHVFHFVTWFFLWWGFVGELVWTRQWPL